MATLSLFQRSSTQWLDRQVDSGRISPSRRASGCRGFFRYVKDGEDKRRLTSNLLIRRWSRYGILVAVTSEEAYGNKEVISLTPRIYDYVLSNVRELGGRDILEINHPVGPFGTKLIGFYKSKLCTLHLLRCFPAHSLKSNAHASNRFKKKDTRREK